jgi:hypothetical protein
VSATIEHISVLSSLRWQIVNSTHGRVVCEYRRASTGTWISVAWPSSKQVDDVPRETKISIVEKTMVTMER